MKTQLEQYQQEPTHLSGLNFKRLRNKPSQCWRRKKKSLKTVNVDGGRASVQRTEADTRLAK